MTFKITANLIRARACCQISLPLIFLLGAFVQAQTPTQIPTQTCVLETNPDRLRNCAEVQTKAGQLVAATRSLRTALKSNPTASNWRMLGDLLAQQKQFEFACLSYRKAIAIYKPLDANTAEALSGISSRFCQEAQIYWLEAPFTQSQKLARLEPKNGLLMGFSVLNGDLNEQNRVRATEVLHHRLAVYFTYYPLEKIGKIGEKGNPGIGSAFPFRLAQAAARDQAALHIALEPQMLLKDLDQASVERFARAAKFSNVPIYLRFAAEFNDPANEWSKDPELYKEKFRLVHDVLAKLAPNVALVWMPMATRLEGTEKYYPGAQYVDWVGVSLYSVPMINGKAEQNGEWISPLDTLEPFYRRYSLIHPFQVSEYGSSHFNAGYPQKDFGAFAVNKLEALYWGAYFKYPRLKNINWLNLDMAQSSNGKSVNRQNDYRLLEVPAKKAALLEILKNPYFLSDLTERSSRPMVLAKKLKRGSSLNCGSWIKLAQSGLENVAYRWDGKVIAVANHLPYRFTLDLSKATLGMHSLELLALDTKGNVLLKKTFPLEVIL